ncbi:VIP peptides-like [Myxocyprinus asiaticus]|uniref:VIP peptides-like n=1 Tax=Myxocyprinus asiaticus TaxID=70543 RepID=UPI00222383EB|nr:VIP peptides-like [Myxocyprinus asiaticus]XP_051528360.1 VIP peptides-like [Myxocyprinus asiaticus]
MMERSALLTLCCLFLLATSCPICPSLRFGQRAAAILMTSSIDDPVQLQADTSSHTTDAEFGFRSGRHADAIFTNSYRKVLGQISARKFLQTVMGKRTGPETQNSVKRQPSIYGDTYKQDMFVIQREQSYRKPQTVKKTTASSQ